MFTKEQLYNKHGIAKTQTLFLEDKYDYANSLFTIDGEDKERDGKLYISLKKLFIQIEDPTEYKFAIQVFGSWKYWERLRDCGLMRKALPKWHEELEIKLKSEALDKIIEVSKDTDKPNTAYQASKFLVKEYFQKEKQDSSPKRGRPSKEEVQGELAKEARVSKELQKHLERVGLKPQVVN